MRKRIFIEILCFSLCISGVLALTDVTVDVLTDSLGVIAAFGDFNGDKHADVFVISQNGE